LPSAGKKTARFLLAGACDSDVPYVPCVSCVRCVGWKPRLNPYFLFVYHSSYVS